MSGALSRLRSFGRLLNCIAESDGQSAITRTLRAATIEGAQVRPLFCSLQCSSPLLQLNDGLL